MSSFLPSPPSTCAEAGLRLVKHRGQWLEEHIRQGAKTMKSVTTRHPFVWALACSLIASAAQATEADWVFHPSPELGYLQEGHAMAYDSARGLSVLYGGCKLDEHWEWDGNYWTQPPPVYPNPGLRWGHSMAYDSARDVTVLFAGFVDHWDWDWPWSKTWEWDGTYWTLASEAGPSPRNGHAMAYDSADGVVTLYGGGEWGDVARDDTWEWNGSTWIQQYPAANPGPRVGHAVAYDSAHDVTVLFGGLDENGVELGDTWEWNGKDWTQQSDTGPDPQADHAMAYDSARGVTVLAGQDETWEWNGTVWEQQHPAHTPGRLYDPAMVYDSARGVMVLVNIDGETWEYTAPQQDCVGDLDGDNDTDHSDLGILLGDWGCVGSGPDDCPGDLDGDFDTDHADLGVLLGDWGCGTTP